MASNKVAMNLHAKQSVLGELQRLGVRANIVGSGRAARLEVTAATREIAHVEVKASTTGRFLTKFYQRYTTETEDHPSFWALCLLIDDQVATVYVLTHEEMAAAQAIRNAPDGASMTWSERVDLVPHGVDNVLARDLGDFEGNWRSITEWAAKS